MNKHCEHFQSAIQRETSMPLSSASTAGTFVFLSIFRQVTSSSLVSVFQTRQGDRVAYGWIRDSCRACSSCIVGQENICKKGYTGLIMAGNKGGFQSRMRAPADFAIKIPDALPSADTAPLMCAGKLLRSTKTCYVRVYFAVICYRHVMIESQ